MLPRWASLLVAIVLAAVILSQCRRPWGWPGRLMVWLMGHSHAGVTAWGLGHVRVGERDAILDIGCGGGRTIHALAERALHGKVYGVDYSPVSVAAAARHNAAFVRAGRVEISRASVEALPFPDDTFTLVTAVETHYYWPDLSANLREVRRTLAPGGTFLLIAESYKRRGVTPTAAIMRTIGAKYLTAGEHEQLLIDAGFVDVRVHEEPRRGWLCAVGRQASRDVD